MSPTRKLTLATLVVALAAGITACNKKPVTDEPNAAEQLGTDTGQVQQHIEQGWDNARQSTSDAADKAGDTMDAAADKAKAAGEDAKQSASDAKADFKKGYDANK